MNVSMPIVLAALCLATMLMGCGAVNALAYNRPGANGWLLAFGGMFVLFVLFGFAM